ncbi:MAG: hypothetical protein A2V66_11380 [Ignavibacteria bacterium RBG_13_36_8]|nr:MAG: hypothetical protein A2V66_11380 [Ignavibacteria bacterium RBG_13_36_8]
MALFTELSPDIIFRIDSAGKISLANNSAHRLFPDQGLLGEYVKNILPELFNYNLDKIITGGEKIEFTAIVMGRAYQFILAGISKAEIGHIYGRDITELKKKQEELAKALVKAEEAKELKADFLARISHEIRIPLAAIQGFTQLILEDLSDKIDAEHYDMFRSIENNSKRLYRTIDLILNMSQIQTGEYEPKFEEVELFLLLKKQYNEFESLANEKKIIFTLESTLGKKVIIRADHYSVEQLFINLIDNAFKFTSKGKISIEIYESSGNICVDISDTGIGISQEYSERLFTPFTQERMGYSRPYEGTGLGLALVKSFADMNKAHVSLKSSINEGSTFTVAFRGINTL